MNNQPDFERVLAYCLDAIHNQNRSVADCLAEYPAYAQEMAPLLQVAVQLRQLRRVRPSLAFRQQAPAQLQRKLKASRRPVVERDTSGSAWSRLFSGRRIARAVGALAVVSVLAGVTSAAAYAADGSVPGDILYPVDRAVENFRLQFTVSPAVRLTLQLEFADERLVEAEQLATAGDRQHLDEAVAGYEASVESASETAVSVDEAGETELEESLSRHEQRLQELLNKVPEQARPGIRRAIEASRRGQERRRGGSDHPGQGGGPPNDHPGNSQNHGGGPPNDHPGNGQGNGSGNGNSGNQGGGRDNSP